MCCLADVEVGVAGGGEGVEWGRRESEKTRKGKRRGQEEAKGKAKI